MNTQIKLIARAAGITSTVQINETRGGKNVTRQVSKCELVTTHTARRSAATNMYLAGIPSISIMKITGHRTEKNFMKYIRITQAENAALIQSNRFFFVTRLSALIVICFSTLSCFNRSIRSVNFL